MNALNLINAIRFYLRQARRLKRDQAQPNAELPAQVEAALWAYAQQAADRLEHLRRQAGQPLQPVSIKRPTGNYPAEQ
jgi:hypothetical protein